MARVLRQRDVADVTGASVVVNARDVQRAIRKFDRDLEREVRRDMRGVATWARGVIRAPWTVGPSAGGHSYRAVTGGTHGLVPYVKLRRSHPRYPYVGWLVFGGRRRRQYRNGGVRVDRQARSAPRGGHWFYPGIARTRPKATRAAVAALEKATRQAGLG